MKGKKVGQFILDDKINEGGFGELWKAHYEENPEKKVALKILQENSWIDLFKKEARTLNSISHPKICKALESDLEGEFPYIALEYVKGKTLREILKEKGAYSLDKAISYLEELLQILIYLHNKGVVHCDLKPENIMVQPDGSLKLLDFGLSISAQKEASQILLSGALDTASRKGNIAGTLQYMAPEQKKGEVLGPETDLYALGIMFFEFLTGELPELGEVPSQMVPILPAQVDKIYLKCVSRRDKRYQKSEDLWADLLKLRAPGYSSQPKESFSGKTSQEIRNPGWYKQQVNRWQNFKERVRHSIRVAYRATKIAVLVLFLALIGFALPSIYKAGLVDPSEKLAQNHVFDIKTTAFATFLNNKVLPKDLKKKFEEENVKLGKEKSIKVKVVKADQKWQIDSNTGHWIIKNEKGVLAVYSIEAKKGVLVKLKNWWNRKKNTQKTSSEVKEKIDQYKNPSSKKNLLLSKIASTINELASAIWAKMKTFYESIIDLIEIKLGGFFLSYNF